MGAGHDHGTPMAADGHPGDHRRKLWFAFSVTGVIVLAQAVGAVITGSLALLTDTAHAIADASGLLVALIAATLMLRPANPKRTWGFRRIEVIAALGQSTLLLGVGAYAAVEGVRRLFEPPEVPGTELLVFGIVGLAANIVAILVLSSSRSANFNMRAAFLEVLNDALGSVGVIVAAIVIATTGFMRADAIAGLFIAGLIVPRAIKLMRETASVLMEFTPADLDLDQVRRHIAELDHVVEVHDLHASTVATGLPVLTAHIVVRDDCFRDGHAVEILETVKACVAEHFAISVPHSTFQIETSAVAAHEPAIARHD
ncbi:putative cation efflux protein [Gordonia araii NBRC 100433]|uniref:Putative cation efflux protein n=1 Tax=Gordonia araii NBRC 100433 TaxID=1073574 RepID=G7GYU0_9ACTN|nr:cation diffusion facilitator family transporter [Gordonia araii]NNG96976.1 cation transporter [Gordonia araii NBRC 100433]GAB08765.1 putative cation efflux protein [Gordonia araii NBRC 100433]